jgi:hypothetical protein
MSFAVEEVEEEEEEEEETEVVALCNLRPQFRLKPIGHRYRIDRVREEANW